MNNLALYILLADLVLTLHFLFVAFVILLFVSVLAGRFLDWHWIYNRRLRSLHLLAIGIVIVQAWLGRLCPLTAWEQALRQKAGQPLYDESFVQHWLQQILFFEGEPWLFATVYTLFGAGVVACWLVDRNRFG